MKKFLKDKKYQRTIYLIKYIYENISQSGGAMHVVLDDGNLEDHHIKFCLDESIPEVKNETNREVFKECAELLLTMPEKERYDVMGESFK